MPASFNGHYDHAGKKIQTNEMARCEISWCSMHQWKPWWPFIPYWFFFKSFSSKTLTYFFPCISSFLCYQMCHPFQVYQKKITYQLFSYMINHFNTFDQKKPKRCVGPSVLHVRICLFSMSFNHTNISVQTCNSKTTTPLDLKVLHKVGLQNISDLLKDSRTVSGILFDGHFLML